MADDIALYLTTGTGVVPSSACKIFKLPEDPDIAVAIIERPGLPSMRVFQRDLPAYERARVQILVRGSTSGTQAARTMADNIWQQMVKVANQVLPGATSGFTYLTIDDVSPPASAGLDQKGRPMFSAYYEVWPAR